MLAQCWPIPITSTSITRSGADQIVGMRDTPEYHRLKDLMIGDLAYDDKMKLEKIVSDSAYRLISAKPSRFDAVAGYWRLIAIELTKSYLGVVRTRRT